MKKLQIAILLSSLSASCVCGASPALPDGFDDWKVTIANGDMHYDAGTILANNGTGRMPEPAVISVEKGGTATITSPGDLTLYGFVKENFTPEWVYGLYDYSSTGGNTVKQVTDLVVDANLNVVVESGKVQSPGSGHLAEGIYMTAQQSTKVGTSGDSAITKTTYLKPVNVDVLNQTESIKGYVGGNTKVAVGIRMFGSDGGRVEATFKDALTVKGTALNDGFGISGIRVIDQVANGEGSTLHLQGDTKIDVNAQSGAVWGFMGQANGGTQTIKSDAGKKLEINATQKDGKYFTYA